MQLIRLNDSTFVNLDALALVEPERGAIHGEARLRVAFLSGTEIRLSGEKAEVLLAYLTAEALSAPGLAVPEEEHL